MDQRISCGGVEVVELSLHRTAHTVHMGLTTHRSRPLTLHASSLSHTDIWYSQYIQMITVTRWLMRTITEKGDIILSNSISFLMVKKKKRVYECHVSSIRVKHRPSKFCLDSDIQTVSAVCTYSFFARDHRGLRLKNFPCSIKREERWQRMEWTDKMGWFLRFGLGSLPELSPHTERERENRYPDETDLSRCFVPTQQNPIPRHCPFYIANTLQPTEQNPNFSQSSIYARAGRASSYLWVSCD